MPDLAGQVERRLSEKNIDATVGLDESVDSHGAKRIHLFATVSAVNRQYGYSVSVSNTSECDADVLRKEVALGADEIAKEIRSDFSTYMDYNDRTVVMVEELSNTIRTKCLACKTEVELQEDEISRTVPLLPEVEGGITTGEVTSFQTKSGYDSLDDEEKAVAKLYMYGKIDRECECKTSPHRKI